ncbi:unnamed protein product [Pleuronectes platessa]|uniref:Uncharacterized protein n=1 Tax=Pleuronectes platessa TaxID=8262 RepID=A0A9N7VND4_PLEPL|nr:unnamed protein product [Pleuronectes platessa]
MGSSAVAVSSSVGIFPLAHSFLPSFRTRQLPSRHRPKTGTSPAEQRARSPHPPHVGIRFHDGGACGKQASSAPDFNSATSRLPQPSPLPQRTRSVRLSSALHPPTQRAKRLKNVPERPKSKPRHAPCQVVLASAVFLELRACVCASVRVTDTTGRANHRRGAHELQLHKSSGTHETRLACDVQEKRTKQQRGCVVWDLSLAWPRRTVRLALGLR